MTNNYQHGAACYIDGCHKSVFGAGLCSTHYQRKRRTGSTDDPVIQSHLPCTLAGCETNRFANGLCQKHYQAKQRYGDPLIQKGGNRSEGPCRIKDCQKPARIKQLCMNHYANFKYHRSTGRFATPEAYIQTRNDAE